MATKKTEEHVHAAKIAKQHTVYKNSKGQRIPGTTTITGVANKPALVKWANDLGLKGIVSSTYVDELATIGTLAHYLIESWCLKVEPDLGDFSPNQLELARNSFNKWLSWQEATGFVPEHNELELVSERFQFGGTLDIIGVLTKRANRRALVDIKTAKACYPEQKTQVAGGYLLIAKEHQETIGQIDDVIITRVGRNSDEGFEEIVVQPSECIDHMVRFIGLRSEYESLKLVDTYRGPCKNPEEVREFILHLAAQKEAFYGRY